MDNSQLSRRWLIILVSLHVFLWTIIPAITTQGDVLSRTGSYLLEFFRIFHFYAQVSGGTPEKQQGVCALLLLYCGIFLATDVIAVVHITLNL